MEINESFYPDTISTVDKGFGLPTPKDRNLFFTGYVSQEAIANVNRSILEINSNDAFLSKLYPLYGQMYIPRPIKIYIDTYGGELQTTLGLVSIINTSKTPIHTIVTGNALSAGFMILINGHRRFAYSLSSMMYHQLSSGAFGRLKDMIEDVDHSKYQQAMVESIVIKKTNITQQTLQDAFEKKKDLFFNAAEALQYSIVDEIIS